MRCRPHGALFLRAEKVSDTKTTETFGKANCHALNNGGRRLRDPVFLNIVDIGTGAKRIETIGVERAYITRANVRTVVET